MLVVDSRSWWCFSTLLLKRLVWCVYLYFSVCKLCFYFSHRLMTTTQCILFDVIFVIKMHSRRVIRMMTRLMGSPMYGAAWWSQIQWNQVCTLKLFCLEISVLIAECCTVWFLLPTSTRSHSYEPKLFSLFCCFEKSTVVFMDIGGYCWLESHFAVTVVIICGLLNWLRLLVVV